MSKRPRSDNAAAPATGHEAATNEAAVTATAKKQRMQPSSARATMDSLARVEVQSIMHFLQRGELSQLARCSRRVYSDADDKAAWRYVDTSISFDSQRPGHATEEVSAGIRMHSLALRHHPPTRVACVLEEYDVHLEAAIHAMQPLRTLAELKIDVRRKFGTFTNPFIPASPPPSHLTRADWHGLLTRLPLATMHSLHIGSTVGDESLLQSMAYWLPTMASLHTLHIGAWPERDWRPITSAICRLPRLTDLHVFIESCGCETVIYDLVDCSNLTALSIEGMPTDQCQWLFQDLKSDSRSLRSD
jgi:hypothetical protein